MSRRRLFLTFIVLICGNALVSITGFIITPKLETIFVIVATIGKKKRKKNIGTERSGGHRRLVKLQYLPGKAAFQKMKIIFGVRWWRCNKTYCNSKNKKIRGGGAEKKPHERKIPILVFTLKCSGKNKSFEPTMWGKTQVMFEFKAATVYHP